MITTVNDTNQIKGQFLTIKQSPKVIIILVLVQTGDATMSLGQCVCMHFQNRADDSVHVRGGEEVEGRMGGFSTYSSL